MARNEEKQHGRLNRLWLQKEKEEGRVKDPHERRPKLSTLNSSFSVKKWIPSIEKEIEYYLQQSQLSHYPERKIEEFQLRIEALEKEYKRFIAKLRVLDPSCKQDPWTPRVYCKRRADTQESPCTAKNPRHHEWSGSGSDSTSRWTACCTTSERRGPPSHSQTVSKDSVCEDQDQPLAFDHTRLAVATAAFRGQRLAQLGSCQTQSLARVLQSSLPNLVNASSRQTFSARSTDGADDERIMLRSVVGQKSAARDCKPEYEAVERIPGKPSSAGEERTSHVLGLDCYSSSDEDTL